MTTMQDHPIDLIRAQMAVVARTGGRGLLGLGCGLALIGALWLGTLKPADAAGNVPATGWTGTIAAYSTASGHAGAAPATLDGMTPAARGPVTVSLKVCRLVLDPAAAAPVQSGCGPFPLPRF